MSPHFPSSAVSIFPTVCAMGEARKPYTRFIAADKLINIVRVLPSGRKISKRGFSPHLMRGLMGERCSLRS